ncbi:MAG: pitrilysin family protein [Myxococcales bacterium]
MKAPMIQGSLSLGALLFVASCASAPKPAPATPSAPAPDATAAVEPAMPARQPPPKSAVARDISFPEVHHVALENGLTLEVVRQTQLPIVSMELVIQSGSASDPAELPGTASLLADMLKEGTKKKSSAQFAEAVEFLGAHLNTGAGQETLRISMNSMSEHFDAALALVAEAALTPLLDQKELDKLKKRTLDDLTLKMDKPVWLARRELSKALYGQHPYSRIDTNEKAVKKLKRTDLVAFHGAHFAPNNAFLVVVGDVTPEQVKASAEKLFGKWAKKTVVEPVYAAPPSRTSREIIVVDRPASVQSQIVIANLALKRNDPNFIPLMVANQVLGGSAASRLFMDLREKRSLTYGAYSRLDETVDVGSIRASAAVRTQVTGDAMDGFYEHLNRITREAPPQAELEDAHRFLADSFPLQIETADRIAELVSDLRVYGLPDGYWDSFRSNIRKVDSRATLAAAQAYIHPSQDLVVVVGKAADVVPALEKFGPVSVVDVNGNPLRSPAAVAAPAVAPAAPPAPPAPGPAVAPAPPSPPATPPALAPAPTAAPTPAAPAAPAPAAPAQVAPAPAASTPAKP